MFFILIYLPLRSVRHHWVSSSGLATIIITFLEMDVRITSGLWELYFMRLCYSGKLNLCFSRSIHAFCVIFLYIGQLPEIPIGLNSCVSDAACILNIWIFRFRNWRFRGFCWYNFLDSQCCFGRLGCHFLLYVCCTSAYVLIFLRGIVIIIC